LIKSKNPHELDNFRRIFNKTEFHFRQLVLVLQSKTFL